MRCISPYVSGGHAFGCGQCMPCRFNQRRTWMHRILLETLCHDKSSFVTLTYNEESLPADGSLRPRDLTLFLKKFRRRFDTQKFRYFAVGEYGDLRGRPHFHLALFNFGPCENGSYLWSAADERARGECQCQNCLGVRSTWGFGRVQVGMLDITSSRYLCGYTTKKMVSKDDPRLAGRQPEFARMSTHPGLGAGALSVLVDRVNSWNLSSRETPSALRHGQKMLPLGSYLKNRLKAELGHEEEDLRDAPGALRAYEELLVMWRNSIRDGTSVRKAFGEANRAYNDALEGRFNKARGTL